jgi:hypothetical protein
MHSATPDLFSVIFHKKPREYTKYSLSPRRAGSAGDPMRFLYHLPNGDHARSAAWGVKKSLDAASGRGFRRFD